MKFTLNKWDRDTSLSYSGLHSTKNLIAYKLIDKLQHFSSVLTFIIIIIIILYETKHISSNLWIN